MIAQNNLEKSDKFKIKKKGTGGSDFVIEDNFKTALGFDCKTVNHPNENNS